MWHFWLFLCGDEWWPISYFGQTMHHQNDGWWWVDDQTSVSVSLFSCTGNRPPKITSPSKYDLDGGDDLWLDIRQSCLILSDTVSEINTSKNPVLIKIIIVLMVMIVMILIKPGILAPAGGKPPTLGRFRKRAMAMLISKGIWVIWK